MGRVARQVGCYSQYGQCDAGRFPDVAAVGPHCRARDLCPGRVRAPLAASVYCSGRPVARDIGQRVPASGAQSWLRAPALGEWPFPISSSGERSGR